MKFPPTAHDPVLNMFMQDWSHVCIAFYTNRAHQGFKELAIYAKNMEESYHNEN